MFGICSTQQKFIKHKQTRSITDCFFFIFGYLKFLKITQSKSEMQKQEVCTVSSIVLLLTLIRHNTAFMLPVSPVFYTKERVRLLVLEDEVFCVFRPANRCSARCSLVEINFLTLKQLFAYFKVIKCIKLCKLLVINMFYYIFLRQNKEKTHFPQESTSFWVSTSLKE